MAVGRTSGAYKELMQKEKHHGKGFKNRYMLGKKEAAVLVNFSGQMGPRHGPWFEQGHSGQREPSKKRKTR